MEMSMYLYICTAQTYMEISICTFTSVQFKSTWKFPYTFTFVQHKKYMDISSVPFRWDKQQWHDLDHLINQPGQLLEPHLRVWEFVPGQLAPPFLGEGLLHVLSLRCDPLPHVIEHVLHDRQPDQPPLTVEITLFVCCNWNLLGKDKMWIKSRVQAHNPGMEGMRRVIVVNFERNP